MTDVPTWADDPVVAAPAPAWADVPVPPVDKYREAALQEYDTLSKGRLINPTPTGYAARAAKPFMMGWGDDIGAAAMVPGEMIKRRTLDVPEAYRYTRAREDVNAEKMAERTKGFWGGAAEGLGIAGSVGNFIGGGTRAAAAAIPGTVAAKIPAAVMNTASNVGRGAAYGAIQGAGDAPSAETMGQQAVAGGAMGGVLGGVLPIAVKSAMAAGGVSQLPRLRDPSKVAVEEVAAAARSAGVTPEEIIARLQAGKAAGQPFTVADAIGHEGQRKLTAQAKVPGEQRQPIIDFLAKRGEDMGPRVSGQVGASMGAPYSAARATEALTQKAKTEAKPFYDAAEKTGKPIWSEGIDEFLNEPTMQSIIKHGVTLQRQESLIGGKPFKPNDYGITGFNEAGDPIIKAIPNMPTLHAAKVGLDSMIDAQRDKITGAMTNQGRVLQGVQKRLLAEIDRLNPDYATARRLFAGPQAVKEAVRVGSTWPTTGRAIDNVSDYSKFNPTAQQGARIGYADTVQKQIEKTGNMPSILKAKSAKGQQEIEALAPYGPNSLKDYLRREETMQATSNKAAGGSSSVENAADIANSPSAASVFGGFAKDMLTGNFMGGGKNLLDAAKIYGKGQSEAQRVAISRALMETDPKKAQALMDAMADFELRRRGVNPFRPDAAPRYGVGQ